MSEEYTPTSTRPNSPQNLFDAYRHIRDNGTEYWSARDLQTLLGYEKWERFQDSIDRARASCGNAGNNPEDHFPGAGKMVEIGSGALREAKDFHLSRFGAYLVAMNGDPRKPEIAAAQTYFAQQTRRAEIEQSPQFEIPATYAAALMLAATQAAELEAKDEQLAIAAPKVEAYELLLGCHTALTWEQVAKNFRIGRTTMLRNLKAAGVIQNNLLPYQKYMHHFQVHYGTYTRNGVATAYYTVRVLPTGLAFLGRKLGILTNGEIEVRS